MQTGIMRRCGLAKYIIACKQKRISINKSSILKHAVSELAKDSNNKLLVT